MMTSGWINVRSMFISAALAMTALTSAAISGTVVSDTHYNPPVGFGTVNYDPLNWSMSIDSATNRVLCDTTGWLYDTSPYHPGSPFFVRVLLDGSVYASQSMTIFSATARPFMPNLIFSGVVLESAITRNSSNPHTVTFELVGSGSNVTMHRTVMQVWKV